MNAIDSFADEVNEHILERRCRAKICKGLIGYEADREAAARPENATALQSAAEVCLNALTGESDGACLDCMVCRETLPELVRVVDKFPPGVGPAPELISVQPAYE